MKIIKADNYEEMSALAGAHLSAIVKEKPDCVLGLATGSTPEGTYAELIRRHRDEGLDFSRVRTVNLDEYLGISPENENSYRRFMNDKLFNGLNILKENTHVPNGMAENPDAECKRYDELVDALGGIDCQLLGVGTNGHIGFNEPGDEFISATHVTELDASTIEANKRFFESEDQVPRRALTLGIGGIMSAKSILLIASGANKAKALKDAFGGRVSPRVPASIIAYHPNVTVIADKEALAELEK